MSIPSSEYNRYLAAIKAANDSGTKELLRQIRDALYAPYGPLDDDVDYLIRQFRYNIYRGSPPQRQSENAGPGFPRPALFGFFVKKGGKFPAKSP